MFSPEKIIELMQARDLQKVQVYEALGMSRQGFSQILAGNARPNLENLEKLADFFGVSIDYFFGRQHFAGNIGNTQINGNYVGGNLVVNEIAHLKELLQEKEIQLQEKERTIRILLGDKEVVNASSNNKEE